MSPDEIIERIYEDLDRRAKLGEPRSRELVVRTVEEHMHNDYGWRHRRRLCEEFLPEEAACEWPTSEPPALP